MLAERSWTQSDLASVLGRPLQAINEVIQGKKGITPEMAVALGVAFGNGGDFWMRAETEYRLSLVRQDVSDVSRRVKVYDYAPVKEMMRRQWIKTTNDADEIESELCRFFGVSSLDDQPTFRVDTRRTDRVGTLNAAQRAWCFRAARLARALQSATYDESRIPELIRKLRQLAGFPEEIHKVGKILSAFGIRLVLVEPLSGTRIDGAAFWLDDQSPVIALTIRYDRIDSFWFTLMHELSHIRNRDSALLVDVDLVGEQQAVPFTKEDIEQRADREAAESLIPPDELRSFVVRVRPMYSKARINQFANRIRVHPGIIVGQLQHLGEIGYSANREMLVKVRDSVAGGVVTDGWGRTVSV